MAGYTNVRFMEGGFMAWCEFLNKEPQNALECSEVTNGNITILTVVFFMVRFGNSIQDTFLYS